MDTKKKLRELIASDQVLMAPCAFDALSARIIQAAGFPIIATTGFGIHGAKLGVPDNGTLMFNEMLDTLSAMCDAVEAPVMADAEGGYGNATNTYRTIKSFEKAGLAGLFIEDQQLPTNCPFLKGTRMIPVNEMIGKIHAALDARTDPNFVIVARTEGRGQEAIDRANAYLEAGADMVKPIPHTRAELELYAREIKGLLHLGFTPGKDINRGLTAADATKMGYRIITFPMTALFAGVKAMMNAMVKLKELGTDDSMIDDLMTFDDYFHLVQFDRFKEMDIKYSNV